MSELKIESPLTLWVSCIYRREEVSICPRPPEKYMIYTLGPWAFTLSPFIYMSWAIFLIVLLLNLRAVLYIDVIK